MKQYETIIKDVEVFSNVHVTDLMISLTKWIGNGLEQLNDVKCM